MLFNRADIIKRKFWNIHIKLSIIIIIIINKITKGYFNNLIKILIIEEQIILFANLFMFFQWFKIFHNIYIYIYIYIYICVCVYIYYFCKS